MAHVKCWWECNLRAHMETWPLLMIDKNRSNKLFTY